jgi:outer membrane protein OmpA-like peptidoglycan-associated protein
MNQMSKEDMREFQQLQELLLGSEIGELRNSAASIKQSLSELEHQIYDPQELSKLLLPSITELLKLKAIESKEEIIQVIASILDRAIRTRSDEDKTSMGSALASVIPVAISEQIRIAPEEISNAIAPTMGRAMKKQIEIEQDTIVDALYPIIGNTIAKYMAETLRAINQQIEHSLSVDGIKRKIRAKLQGVSEAELILKEALPFTVQAIFLIHKTSGLIISDIQPSDTQHIESEMVAGMLTAIRSFANDCINQSGGISELNAIDYGRSKIILEVAGYCYLAIVVQGEPSKEFIWKMRRILGKVITDYGYPIEQFNGDSETIPNQVHLLLETLKCSKSKQKKDKKNQPSPLLIFSGAVLSMILIPWGIWQYHTGVIHSIENKTALALASAPELAVYRLTVNVESNKLKLKGLVPNELLREKAEKIAKLASPEWLINNQILTVEVPVDPVLAAAEVRRVTKVLNQINGTAISAKYLDGKVNVEGNVRRTTDANIVTNAFEQIPGVKLISSAVIVGILEIKTRFYFELNSANLVPKDFKDKVKSVKFFLDEYPMKNLQIIGYSYAEPATSLAQSLALKRANTVKKALINQGVESSRLQVFGKTSLPPEINVNQPEWLSRCVRFEVINQ